MEETCLVRDLSTDDCDLANLRPSDVKDQDIGEVLAADVTTLGWVQGITRSRSKKR